MAYGAGFTSGHEFPVLSLGGFSRIGRRDHARATWLALGGFPAFCLDRVSAFAASKRGLLQGIVPLVLEFL